MYAANFHTGEVEVYNSQFHLISEFTDPDWPNGYAPYNVQSSGGDLYVTFAKQDQTKTKAVPGLGNGFVDEFAPAGALIERFDHGGAARCALGPGNGPGRLRPVQRRLAGGEPGQRRGRRLQSGNRAIPRRIRRCLGTPITNAGLHGLLFGAGGSLYFTAGPGGGADGVFGSLSPTPDTVTIAATTLAAAISNITAFVNQPYNGVVATFTDANIYALASDFTATIDWGDGSADTSGDGNVTIIHTDGIGSSFMVQGIHTYTTSTTGYPLDIVTITISENGTPNSVFAQGTASVSEPTLHVALSGDHGDRERTVHRDRSRRSPTTLPTQTRATTRRRSIGETGHPALVRSPWRTRPARATS